jgi:hypothetical protein
MNNDELIEEIATSMAETFNERNSVMLVFFTREIIAIVQQHDLKLVKEAIEKKILQYPNYSVSRIKNDHMREAMAAVEEVFNE